MTPDARTERGLNSSTALGNPRESRPTEDRIRLKKSGLFAKVLLCGGFGGAPLLHEQRNAASVSILSGNNLR